MPSQNYVQSGDAKRNCAARPCDAWKVRSLREWSILMQLTRVERLLAEAGIMALCGCILAISGLFVEPDVPLGARLAYWIIGLLAAWTLVQVLSFVGTAVAKMLGLAPQWGYALTIPLATVGIAWGILYWTGGSEMAMSDGFGRVWISASIYGVGFFALFYALYARAEASSEIAPETAREIGSKEDKLDEVKVDAPSSGTSQTQLHKRLPPGFPAIIALSVEDHYNRVHAAGRSEMVLMPLSEAITLVPETIGQQVHRSWWAAREAVASHKREGRDIKLVLENELEVPVSRAQVKTLREDGWLS